MGGKYERLMCDPRKWCVLTYLLTHSLTHSLTYSLTHLLTYVLSYSLTYLLTYLLRMCDPRKCGACCRDLVSISTKKMSGPLAPLLTYP